MLRRIVPASVAVLAMALPVAAADGDRWTLDLGGERAGVSLGESRDTWWSGRAQITHRREGSGGAFAAVEPLRRFSSTDVTIIAGAWRHSGPWSYYAEAGGTPRADFHCRWSGEAEVFRRVTGPWVAHAAQRLRARLSPADPPTVGWRRRLILGSNPT